MSANDEMLRQRHEEQANNDYFKIRHISSYVNDQIAKIESDERYRYKPANVQANAYLALEQTAMQAKMMILNEIRNLLK